MAFNYDNMLKHLSARPIWSETNEAVRDVAVQNTRLFHDQIAGTPRTFHVHHRTSG